jgi:hypothetical protein
VELLHNLSFVSNFEVYVQRIPGVLVIERIKKNLMKRNVDLVSPHTRKPSVSARIAYNKISTFFQFECELKNFFRRTHYLSRRVERSRSLLDFERIALHAKESNARTFRVMNNVPSKVLSNLKNKFHRKSGG